MGRLRATTAKSGLDQAIQAEVATAQAAIDRAIQLCRNARNSGNQRTHKVARDLSRVKSALGNVRRTTPLGDGDPDLMSEDDRNRLWRERLAEERATKEAEERAAAEAAQAAQAAEFEAMAADADDSGGE